MSSQSSSPCQIHKLILSIASTQNWCSHKQFLHIHVITREFINVAWVSGMPCSRLSATNYYSIFWMNIQPITLPQYVTAQLYIMCPGPDNTSVIYSRLATSLWSLPITLPLYYSTTLTSTFPTVSTDIPSYKAIHGRMPLHYYHFLISGTLCIQDIMNYTCPTSQNTLSTWERSYRF